MIAPVAFLPSYFNPRAPCGARPGRSNQETMDLRFQPTRPLRGATGRGGTPPRLPSHFNPRAPCGARPKAKGTGKHTITYFNPRAPCGARQRSTKPPARVRIFQPTRPLRGATQALQIIFRSARFQPTRPLRGATYGNIVRINHLRISTHAPLAGRDNIGYGRKIAAFDISTHAPLAGRDDQILVALEAQERYFNPRAPCGARHDFAASDIRAFLFQPTRPLRGATVVGLDTHFSDDISTHAPLAGRDPDQRLDIRGGKDFNPRAPCGARRSHRRASPRR